MPFKNILQSLLVQDSDFEELEDASFVCAAGLQRSRDKAFGGKNKGALAFDVGLDSRPWRA